MTNYISYRELLYSRQWQEKRSQILRRDGNKCTICGATDQLVVHHKQYHYKSVSNRKCDPWDYDNKYLTTLCQSCHQRGHELYKIPTKYLNK